MSRTSRPGDREARFMGKITAGMTHEIRNVLAIVRESAGLMEDLLSMGKSASFPYRERFLRALSAIQQQVDRGGVDLATRLNRFAHSVDDATCEVDLGELLGQVCALLQRQARNRKVELSVDAKEGELRARTDPFRLGLVHCSCVEHCMEGMDPGGALEIMASRLEGALALEIRPSSGEAGREALWEAGIPEELSSLGDVVEALGIQMAFSRRPEWRCVRLSLGSA